jgi:hypothetical protein
VVVSVLITLAPYPPDWLLELPPLPPIAVTLTLVTPVGTVKVCELPVYVYVQVAVAPETLHEPPVAVAETAPPSNAASPTQSASSAARPTRRARLIGVRRERLPVVLSTTGLLKAFDGGRARNTKRVPP